MWKDQRLTPHQWAFCSYHLEHDRAEEERRTIAAARYDAFLLNLSLLNPDGLKRHVADDGSTEEVVEEDVMFRYRAPDLSEEAMRRLGVGKYGEVPALAPTTLARGSKNE